MQDREERHPKNRNASVAKVEYVLQLFVTGASPHSVRAIANLKALCEKYLKGKYSLQIVDVRQQPELAKKEQIIALPLMIKRLPQPERKFIGDLSDSSKVLKALGVTI